MRLKADLDATPRQDSGAIPSQILIVDDNDSTRRAVRMLLERNREWVVCGEASDGEEAVEAAKRTQPDLIVMDVIMPRLSGLQAAEQISEAVPRSRVLLFTLHSGERLLLPSKQTCIRGLVYKQDAARELAEAVEMVLLGHTYFPSDHRKPAEAANQAH